MELSDREIWAIVHGVVFGSLFLLGFSGLFLALWGFSAAGLSPEAITSRAGKLVAGAWGMAAVAWLTAFSGTWMILPWYMGSGGVAEELLGDPTRSSWHSFGMEWKSHIAWFAPILATAVAICISHFREELAERDSMRHALAWMLAAAFACAGIAGLLGALITRVVPIR